jgi:hypothetical protein
MNTDLKMRRCRGCENHIVFSYEGKMKLIPIYCEECFAKYEGVYNGRS